MGKFYHTSFFFGVWYPLVDNLLYQVTIFSHLMIPSSSHCVVLISHMTVLLSHFVVLLFFLTSDCTILILCGTNITCDCTFVTFDGSFFFSLTFGCIILTLCSTNFTCDVLLSHFVIPFFIYLFLLFIFFTFDGIILTLYSTSITCD